MKIIIIIKFLYLANFSFILFKWIKLNNGKTILQLEPNISNQSKFRNL